MLRLVSEKTRKDKRVKEFDNSFTNYLFAPKSAANGERENGVL